MRFQFSFFVANAALALAGVANITSVNKRNFPLEVTITNGKGTTVKSVDDLVLLSKVTNTGDEPVHVAKYSGIIDGGYTRSFVVKKDGEEIKFVGVRTQLAITYADEEMYLVIAPGETINTEHNVAALYDFASAGTGNFTFEPFIVTRSVDASQIIGDSFTGVAESVSVTITDDVLDRSLVPNIKRQLTNVCQTSQREFIDASYEEGRNLAAEAHFDLPPFPTSTKPLSALFYAYFKTRSSADLVLRRFVDVMWANPPSRTLNCDDPLGQCASGNVVAYTIIKSTNIHFCPIFYNQQDSDALCRGTPVDARNIRGGTMLHEMIHANSLANNQPQSHWVIDVAYGCPQNQALSAFDQLRNADNYNCFATAIYKRDVCLQ